MNLCVRPYTSYKPLQNPSPDRRELLHPQSRRRRQADLRGPRRRQVPTAIGKTAVRPPMASGSSNPTSRRRTGPNARFHPERRLCPHSGVHPAADGQDAYITFNITPYNSVAAHADYGQRRQGRQGHAQGIVFVRRRQTGPSWSPASADSSPSSTAGKSSPRNATCSSFT